MAAGIYTITNTISRKTYIGSTNNFECRWSSHRYALRRGTHDNPHLQRSWDKHGEKAFEFGVLEYLDNLDELVKAEQFWMDIYQEEGRELYNIGRCVDNPMRGLENNAEARRKVSEANIGNQNALGHIVSKEARRRISEGNKGKQHSLGYKLSEDHKRRISEGNRKPYPAFINRDTGEIIPAGMNLSELCRMRGLCCSNMHLVKLGKQKHYKGWMLLENPTRKSKCL